MLIDACGFAARFLLLPEVAVDGELASSEPNSHGAMTSCAVLLITWLQHFWHHLYKGEQAPQITTFSATICRSYEKKAHFSLLFVETPDFSWMHGPHAALILAKVDLVRMGMGDRISSDIPSPTLYHAVSQGTLNSRRRC